MSIPPPHSSSGPPTDAKRRCSPSWPAIIGFPWMPMSGSFEALVQARQRQLISLGLLRPKRLEKLEIIAVDNPEWTGEELVRLLQEQSQGNLFSNDEHRKQLKLLEKLPFDFYYHYICAPRPRAQRKTTDSSWQPWSPGEAGLARWEPFTSCGIAGRFNIPDGRINRSCVATAAIQNRHIHTRSGQDRPEFCLRLRQHGTPRR